MMTAVPHDKRVVLLSGEEFLRCERLDEIVASSVDPETKDFNFDVFYGHDLKKTADARRIAGTVMEFPMMAERRVVVIRFFDSADKEVRKKIAEALKDIPDTTLVLIEGDKVALTPKPPAKVLFEETFKPVYERDISSWIQGRFRKLGKKASQEAVTVLINNIGIQLRELDGEIGKIVMIAGDAPTVTGEHAEKIVGEFRRFTVYALQNAVGTGAFEEAERILHSLMEEERGRETWYVMSLASHIMKLAEFGLLVRSGKPRLEALKALNTNEFMWKLNRMDEQARRFDGGRVRRSLEVLADTDIALKRTGTDNELLCEIMLPRVMGRIGAAD